MTGACIIDDFEVTAAQCRDLEALRALQVEKAQLASREHELLVSIAGAHLQVLIPKGLERQVQIPDPMRSEICFATGWSERFVQSQLHVARTLATTLPLTAAALAAGTLGEVHARMIVATMDRFDVDTEVQRDRLAVHLEARVLPNTLDRAKPMTLAGLRGICNRAVAAIDPKGALLRAKKARDGFDVWVYDDGDGVYELCARMSSLAAHACLRKLDAEDVRDLLVGPHADVTLRRLVTDPLTGQLLDVGRTRYVPSDRLKDFIVIRDGRCRFPGCTRRAANADIDHAVAWNQQGETSRANLGALCRRHHLLKTHAGYNITTSTADGSCTWRTPSAASIEHAPEPVTPINEPDEPPF